jgi:hypothetical protein
MPLPPANLMTPRIPTESRDQIRTIVNVLVDWLIQGHGQPGTRPLDPFAVSGTRQQPFLYALFPGLARVSTIERSMSTRMGTVMEDIAQVVAEGAGSVAATKVDVTGQVAPAVLQYIDTLTRSRRASERPRSAPDVNAEVQTMRGLNSGSMVPHTVEMDLAVVSEGDVYYFDLKTPSPNADQPREMKNRLMRARALSFPLDVSAFAVFYYNPRGLDGRFTHGRAYFDYPQGEVLIGRQFWDLLAGTGTYREVVEVFQEVGQQRGRELLNLL